MMSPGCWGSEGSVVSEERNSYSAQRDELAERLGPSMPKDRARTVAFAVVPWLERGAGTHRFFEELREVHTEFMADFGDGPEESKEESARETVLRYRGLASEHGAQAYVEAAEAALAGADVSALEGADALVEVEGPIPERLVLEVGSTELELAALASKKGNLWYSLTDDSGKPSRGGVAIPSEDSDLPDEVRLEGAPLRLGPAPLWDSTARAYSPTDFEPFDLKRVVERDVVVSGHRFEARVVVSVRKDGNWNVTARVSPQEAVPADQVGRRPSPSRRSAEPHVSASADGPSAQESDLLKALREGLSPSKRP